MEKNNLEENFPKSGSLEETALVQLINKKRAEGVELTPKEKEFLMKKYDEEREENEEDLRKTYGR